MSVWSIRRQLFLFFIVSLIMTGAIALAFWRFWPEPSCFDGRQNQTELDVDCGGGCEAVCRQEVQPVRVLWVRVLPLAQSAEGIGSGVYDLVALVENPNSEFAVTNFPYTLRVTDQENIFINQVSGFVALAPLERFAIFVGNVDVGRRVPARAFLEFTAPPVWQRTMAKPALSLDTPNFSNQPTPVLLAKISNAALAAYQNIEIVAVLSDERHNAFAASATFLEDLPAGEQREVSFSWPRPFTTSPVFIDLYPHVASFSSRVN